MTETGRLAATAGAPPDPVALTQRLIACPSVTPEEGGALALLERVLTPFGFRCDRVDRNGVANLFAEQSGDGSGPTFAFGGHTDVVPVGDAAAWRAAPFGGEIRDGAVWGRGAVDMKSAVAAFVCAAARRAKAEAAGPVDGQRQCGVALLITGDEEGPAVDGTRALLDWMTATGRRVDHCLVGEPTSRAALGDTIKIGRRGSMTVEVAARGRQGHVAYPHEALNPLPALTRLLDGLARATLDEGSAHFDPSTLALTSIDTGNPASNVIPNAATARFNIRFNDRHRSADLAAWVKDQAAQASAESGVTLTVSARVSGEAFLTEPGPFSALVSEAVRAETGVTPALTTGGGTSDARFIKDHCPVVEFGLVSRTMHQVDEHTPVADVERLSRIYEAILARYAASSL